MASITYIARRKLISGHVAGDVYTIDVELTLPLEERGERVVERARALDGTTETTFIRIDDRYSCLTDIVSGSVYAQLREWWYSVADGQEFTLDVYGSSSNPNNPQTVRLIADRWRPQRVGNIGQFRVPFEVEVA